MDIDITVAIPTYNGRNRLPKVIEQLINQNNLENINWEIIIVDNNSTDNTALLIQNYQKNWNYSFALRYFLEKEQGAAFARLCAVRNARGELIAFLDDDNLPDTNWLAAGYSFGKEHPQAGAWSGQIHGEFEVKPPDKFEKIQRFLAIREHGSEPYIFKPENLQLPPGAALVIRKQGWCENVPERPILSGKLPGILVQGDDYEPLLYLHRAGWQIWYNPAMHTYHQIPRWRLEKSYLLNLARGCGLCTCQLRFINAKNWQKPLIFVRTILSNLYRILRLIIRYKGRFEDDLIILFEMEFYWGSMMSPLYLMKSHYRRILVNNKLIEK